MFIWRNKLVEVVMTSLETGPVAALEGARQVGKTTLARMVCEKYNGPVHYFDLEKTSDRAALRQPELVLSDLNGLVVIDEIQRMPELYRALRPLADRPNPPAGFLILGSASPTIVRGVSESLAGRVALHQIAGLSIDEVGSDNLKRLWMRGGFPRSYLAGNESQSIKWREDFIATFLERDLPLLGMRIPSEMLWRFWSMLAHYHGQLWNASEFGRSLQIDQKTARRYLDILTGAFVTTTLAPWHENLKKRQVKAPKVYVRDSGLLHALLTIGKMDELVRHPKYGASWEGFALEQVIMRYPRRNCYFWRTQRGAELDLLVMHGGKRLGYEFKCSDAPTLTDSMRIAMKDLRLERLSVIVPAGRRYPIAPDIEVVPLSQVGPTSGKLVNCRI